MADAGAAADAIWAEGSLSGEACDALLSAVDAAFETVLFARYGGGVDVVLARGGDFKDEQMVRAGANGFGGLISLALHLRGAAGPRGSQDSGPAAAASMTTIGIISMKAGQGEGLQNVHVLTVIFEHQDPNGHSELAPSHEGISLLESRASDAGYQPGGGIVVMRPTPAMDAAIGRRGWQASGQRLRTSRATGLGSNGRERASVSTIACPLAATLLSALGQTLGGTSPFDQVVERVVLGLSG